MKIFAALVLTLSLLAGTAIAIPQSTGVTRLGGKGGESFLIEEWFRDPKHWLANAELPGAWISSSSDSSSVETNSPGAVFGVNAHTAAVVKDAQGAVKEVVIRFDAGKGKEAALITRLMNSISAFQNVKKWDKLADGVASSGSDFKVALQKGSAAGEVIAKLSRSAP